MTWYKVPYVEYGFRHVRTSAGIEHIRELADQEHYSTPTREVILLDNSYAPQVVTPNEDVSVVAPTKEEMIANILELFEQWGVAK